MDGEKAAEALSGCIVSVSDLEVYTPPPQWPLTPSGLHSSSTAELENCLKGLAKTMTDTAKSDVVQGW